MKPSSTLSSEQAQRRQTRTAARKRRQRRTRLRLLCCLVLIAAAGLAVYHFYYRTDSATPAVQAATEDIVPAPTAAPLTVQRTADTVTLGADFPSSYAILLDADSGQVLAEKDAQARICPASMTKILTLLVAAEHITDWDDTYPITLQITDLCYQNECSVVGYLVGDEPTVSELLYGTILPSGADAALALACYVSGSQEEFVALMNDKLRQLGLSDTAHFTNCIGLYDENHYCTVQDMAVILNAAMENELCRQVLSTKVYTTAPTAAQPEGIVLSNWFLRRIEDKDTGVVEVVGAKTGFVVQSGNCAASCGEDADGHRWLCVTGNAYSSWCAIYDHVSLYSTYCR